MSFLTLTDVSKTFGDLHAVTGVNLAVEKGEFVSLLGPSGCGKTTTLQMIAGFIETTRGRIMLDGRDITHMKPNRRGLGIVFQSYALFPHMSVAQNVSFGLEMRGVEKAEREKRTLEAMALIGLGVRRLSITPASVGPVKAMIRSIDAAELRAVMTQWLESGAADIRGKLTDLATARGIELN